MDAARQPASTSAPARRSDNPGIGRRLRAAPATQGSIIVIMRWSALAWWAAIAAVALQPPQPPQPPTFRTEANLVRVDVTVVDRDGEPVTALAADDFAVEEDGVPQAVQSFKFVSADGRPAEGDDVSLEIRSAAHAAAEAARDEVRVFVIFWDEYHIGRFASAIHGRKALTSFVAAAFGPTDLVALMDPLLPVDALRFTRDRTELADRIRKLEGRYGVYTPTRSVIEEAHLQRRDIARVRSEVTVSALKSAAVHLGGLKEGRKAIIFVSEGLAGLGMEEFDQIQELIQAANHTNTAIYTLDPRGLVGGSADILRTLAERTGGEAFVETNTPEKALRQVVKDASAFYLLGYSSARNPQDGRFHSIKVRVKRRGVTVRARRGYWAPNPTDLERARAEAAAGEAVPAEVTNALAVLSAARNERTVDVWIGTARGANGLTEVTAAWTMRRQAEVARSTVSITARSGGGDRVFEAPFDAGGLSFSWPPGKLQLRAIMRDADGTTVDEEMRSISVPDYSGPGLTLSVPVVLRARNAADARAIAGAQQVTPFAGREFVRTDRVFVRFAVYGRTAAQAVVSAQLTNRMGAPLLALSVNALTGGEGKYQIDLPLASNARGDYLVAVEAAQGREKTRMLVPMRVVP
jgi:VWFA-related protein